VTARGLGLVLLVFGLPPAWGADSGLGRLFFTPAERAVLEEARRKNIRAEIQAAEKAKPERAPVRNVTVTGLVRRSDGESTVWVNGNPTDGAAVDGLKVRVTAGQQAAVIVHEPERGRTVRLKVGQRADILTGRVEEGYQRREAAAPQAALPAPAPEPAPPAPTRKGEQPEDDLGQNGPSEDGETPAEAGSDEPS
jgi:hypothetical protein